MSVTSPLIRDPGLAHGHSSNPFGTLGVHDGTLTVCAPGARSVQAITRANGQNCANLVNINSTGIFSGPIDTPEPYLLLIDWDGVIQETEDPYSFSPLLGELDLHLLAEGRHHELARCLGAQIMQIDGIDGVRFALWAPNAQRVSVVGDFNGWDGRRHMMRKRHEAGVWEIFIPRLQSGTIYKYELLGPDWQELPLKADPVALMAEAPPATASVVAPTQKFPWTDAAWITARRARDAAAAPLSIYEVHAGSWMFHDGVSLKWDGLIDKLIPYVVGMGFTHIEFLPVMIHPFGGSWGYQPLGQFGVAAQFGTPDDFARLVDACHAAGLGVILDWVPAHFPTDIHGLAQFDGTSLYEHADPKEGFHRDWNTLIYNLGRNEVRGFLIASALHWLEHYHIDGLRVDAVASMLYRDYSREPGEWVPNIHGGRENLEAVAFLRELNQVAAARCPGTLLIAEESTAWPGVSAPVDQGGLGFNFKWNMGWMHDTLRYIETDPIHRAYHHDEMTFGLIYAFSERFVLPLSHDEVVHGKGALLQKMPGDDWQRFANLRAYFGFMWTHPGKKLLFMGGEFAQTREWNHDRGLDWNLLDQPRHRGMQILLRDLNRLYAGVPALHERDCESSGFSWIIGDDRGQSVLAYLRLAHDGTPVLVVCNFTPIPRSDYRIGVPQAGAWAEIFNSDADLYGGSNIGNQGAVSADGQSVHGQPASLMLTLPPLATIILRPAGA
ncbi:MAG: 1,4-alpha-glucan branching enzyme [Rhodospirillales bacterium 20-60-12]|nr:MAG: 1,4-alpha-glucan branching enzyme [Rhodospirillales bacterium 20-60-12]HQT68599.1 1,4-alpha-glucan branching protein GlgB [Acetobacteraceae bacterium]